MSSVSCHFTSKRNIFNLIKNTGLIFISLEFSSSLLAYDVNDPNKVKRLKIMHNLTSSYCLKVQMQGFFFPRMPLLTELVPFQFFYFQLLCFDLLFCQSYVDEITTHKQFNNFTHSDVKLFTSSMVNIYRAMDYWVFQVVTHSNSIPFFSNVFFLEASYTF